MEQEIKKPARRWTAKRKMEVVLEGFRGEITPAEIARKYGITQAQYFEWRDQVLAAGMAGPRYGGEDDPRVPQLEDQVRRLQQTVGQLTQEKQILQETLGRGKKKGPEIAPYFKQEEYPVEFFCSALGVPRLTYYMWLRESKEAPPDAPRDGAEERLIRCIKELCREFRMAVL